jgi:UDP-N-acetylmuramoyl-tripeptide--D-alanyl-D-alanine ligase
MAIALDLVMSSTGGHCVHRGAESFSAVVIDGRQVPKGALFFAIAGERHDGHDFVAQAVAGGADGVVVKKGKRIEGAASATIIEVEDTVVALGRLARAHRDRMSDLKVVAITGSNGKTTTKEMTAAILGAQVGPDAVLKTEGNLNNHLGVPLTLLRLTPKHLYAVVEMGMNGLGEIDHLAGLARADVAVVVCVAPVHLEQLGTIENIAKAKAEIWKGNAVGIAPVDEPLLKPYWPKKTLTFGARAKGPDVGVDDVSAGPGGVHFTLHLRELTSRQGVNVGLPLVGAHNAIDAAAAAAAARALDVGEGPILEGLSSVRPAKHRSQLVPAKDRVILDDCYNASPLSTRAALDALVSVANKRKIAVLGDMLELGPKSAELHAEIGAYAGERADEVIAFGPLSHHLAEAAAKKLGAEHVMHTEDPNDAAERVMQVSGPGDVILVKASRGMRLERVIDKLLEMLG